LKMLEKIAQCSIVKTTFFGLTLLLASSPTSAQTIEQALSTLQYKHPQIKSAVKAVASSKQEINKATAGFLPKLNVTSDYGPENIDTPTTRSEGNEWQRSKHTATLTVTQNIFQGFSDTSATRTARLNKLVTESALATTSQATMMEGISAFIDVLRQAQLVELTLQNEETIQTQLNLEDERVQKGTGIAVDVLQAKSRLQLAKERRLQFEGDLENSISRYNQVFNTPPDLDKIVEPLPKADLVPDSMEAAIDIALAENPQIFNSDQRVAIAREAKRFARSDLYPVVDFVSKFNYEKHNSGTIGTRRDASFILQANWDLFTGLTSRANIAKASYDYAASRDNYEFATRKIVEGARIAWHNLHTSRKRLVQLENAVNIASEVFSSRKKLRAAGKETVIKVLDAESEITNARINFTTASFDEREAVYALLLSMGRLGYSEIMASTQGAGATLPR
jgi:adhesin transport system outer membrane protein